MARSSGSFEDLVVWKRACGLSVKIFEVLADARVLSLRDQMQRASVSIASNIAEGSERSPKDFRRFLTIARGSAAELRTQAYIAAKIGMIDRKTMSSLVTELKEISRMLVGLSRSLSRDKTP